MTRVLSQLICYWVLEQNIYEKRGKTLDPNIDRPIDLRGTNHEK